MFRVSFSTITCSNRLTPLLSVNMVKLSRANQGPGQRLDPLLAVPFPNHLRQLSPFARSRKPAESRQVELLDDFLVAEPAIQKPSHAAVLIDDLLGIGATGQRVEGLG